MLARKRVILAKIESAYATDSVPAPATDAVLVRMADPTPLEIDYVERSLVRPYLGNFEDLPARTRVKLEIEMELAGFGTAGPATPTPGYAALLRMCGLAQTISAGVDVQYKPDDGVIFESGTIYFYQDGTFHKLTGCRGNVEISMSLNQIPVYKLSITGLYNAVVDAALPTPTLSAYQRPVVMNRANTTPFSLHGYASARLQSLNINLGNQVTHRNLVGQGTDEILITDRAPAGSIEIEATTIAAKDWYAAINAVTLAALALTHGPALNQVKLDAPNVQLTNPRFSVSDGIVHLGMDFKLMPSSSGNDELTITVL